MRRREDRPLSKHTINLFYGDYPKLMTLYPRIGAAKAIRDIIHAHLRKVEEDAMQKLPIVDNLEIELEDNSE